MKISGILTPKALSKKLDISEQTLLSWKKQGMPIVKIGKTVLILEASFLKWLKSHESLQDAPGQEKSKTR